MVETPGGICPSHKNNPQPFVLIFGNASIIPLLLMLAFLRAMVAHLRQLVVCAKRWPLYYKW